MRIGVDLDDVLIDTNEALARFHNTHYGTNYSVTQVRTFDLEEIWNCTPQERMARLEHFYETHDPTTIPAISGAQKVLHELKENHDLLVITGRPLMIQKKSRATLEHYFPGIFREIVSTDLLSNHTHPQPKSHYCKELGIDLFIEDNHKWAHQIASAGIETLLFNTPWNQAPLAHEKVKRIHHWNDVHAHVQQKSKN